MLVQHSDCCGGGLGPIFKMRHFILRSFQMISPCYPVLSLTLLPQSVPSVSLFS